MAETKQTTSGSDNGLLSMSKAGYTLSGISSFASAFGQIANANINYASTKINSMNQFTSASGIELQALQEANKLREQYLNNAAAFQVNAAQRGVSVDSTSVVNNLENSSVALNKDIHRLQTSANLQASALRSTASINNKLAKATRNIQYAQAGADLLKGAGNLYIAGSM